MEMSHTSMSERSWLTRAESTTVVAESVVDFADKAATVGDDGTSSMSHSGYKKEKQRQSV